MVDELSTYLDSHEFIRLVWLSLALSACQDTRMISWLLNIYSHKSTILLSSQKSPKLERKFSTVALTVSTALCPSDNLIAHCNPYPICCGNYMAAWVASALHCGGIMVMHTPLLSLANGPLWLFYFPQSTFRRRVWRVVFWKRVKSLKIGLSEVRLLALQITHPFFGRLARVNISTSSIESGDRRCGATTRP